MFSKNGNTNKQGNGNQGNGLVDPQGKPLTSNTNNNGGNLSLDWINTLINWFFFVVTIPFKIFTAIMNQFLEPGTNGATLLGSLLFCVLVIMSTDSYWQTLFQMLALTPWYEQRWIGSEYTFLGTVPTMIAVGVKLLTNPMFYLAICLSTVIQMFQSACVRGEKFVVSKKVVGLIAIGLWCFDAVLTFTSRNPWQYKEVGMIVSCFSYNLFTIFCAELGRWGEKIMSKSK